MVNKGKDGVSKLFLGLLFAIFFLLVFLLNRMYPLHSDDWMYSFVFNEKPARFVKGIGDIIQSQYSHYLYWGGRNIVHFIDQLLLLFTPIVKELLNSLAYIVFAYLIYKIANGKKSHSPVLFLFINLILWLCLPTFPQTVIWITGSANYLWGALIAIGFVLPYCNYIFSEDSSDSVSKGIFFVIGGVLAGWTTENTALGLLFIIFVFILYLKLKKVRIPQWMIWGFVGACVGCVIMLTAPGNYIRSKDTHAAFNLTDKPMVDVLWYKARNIYLIYKYTPSVWILISSYVCLFVSYYLLTKKSKDYKVIFVSLVFFIAAQVSAFVMIASPIFPVRASFCTHVFMIVSVAILYANIIREGKLTQTINIVFLAVLVVLFTQTYRSRYTVIASLDERYKLRELYINQQKELGYKDIIIEEPEILLPGEFDFEDISGNADSWRNGICADFYELNSIKRINKH